MTGADDRWRVVVGIDPSEASSGWCVLVASSTDRRWRCWASGQCKGAEAPHEVLAALPPGIVNVVVLAVEGIFPGKAKNPDGTERPEPKPHIWRLGFRSGLIAGALMVHESFANATLWTPQPNEWRRVLGVKQGRRAVIAKQMLRWSAATSGFPMEGPRGGAQVDRAMAVGIASAAVSAHHNRCT